MKLPTPNVLKSPVVVDVVVAAVVAVFTLLDVLYNVEGTRQADWVTLLLFAVSTGALLVRRRWPVAVAAICMAALTAWFALGHYGEILQLPTFVALYTIAVQGSRRLTMLMGAVSLLWSASLALISENTLPDFIIDSPLGYPSLTQLVWPVAALILGESVRNRRELLAESTARAQRAEVDRERETQRRVEEERLRIARELHDIVAHTVAGINVQAGVAVDAFDSRPDVARGAMHQVRASGREALVELRATVALLRDDAARVATNPAPHLDQIDELVDRTRSAGITVTLRRETARELPAVVELAAYRIVQEALTNVIRHANARNAAVLVTTENKTVIVEVTDDGSATMGSTVNGDHDDVRSEGFGLIGMNERAAAIGGQVNYGPMPGGGFRVHAVLPTGEDEL